MTERRGSKSIHPKLEALGWGKKDATEVIDLGLARVRKTTIDSSSAYRRSVESLSKVTRELDDELDEDDEDEDDLFDDVITEKHAIP